MPARFPARGCSAVQRLRRRSRVSHFIFGPTAHTGGGSRPSEAIMRVVPTRVTNAFSICGGLLLVRPDAALPDCRLGHRIRARLVSPPIAARLHLAPVRSGVGANDRKSRTSTAPSTELAAGKGCRNEVAGDTIFVARSLWPVPAGRATAKTESYCELDTGDQECSRAIPILVEEQGPLSLEAPVG